MVSSHIHFVSDPSFRFHYFLSFCVRYVFMRAFSCPDVSVDLCVCVFACLSQRASGNREWLMRDRSRGVGFMCSRNL